jgi:hypothetical protein
VLGAPIVARLYFKERAQGARRKGDKRPRDVQKLKQVKRKQADARRKAQGKAQEQRRKARTKQNTGAII